MNVFLALVRKELLAFFRDRVHVLTTFLMPMVFVLLMSFALGGQFEANEGRQVDCLVVDADHGSLSARIIEGLRRAPFLRVEVVRALAAVDVTTARARHAGKPGTLLVVLPAGLTRDVHRAVGDAPPPPAEVELCIDAAVPAYVAQPALGALRGVLDREIARDVMPVLVRRASPIGAALSNPAEWAAADARAQAALDARLSTGERPAARISRTSPTSAETTRLPSTYEQTVPAYTLFGLFWITQVLASSMVRERRSGTLRRLRASPISTGVLLAGKVAPYYLINLLQVAVMFAVAALFFGLELGASPLALVAVSLVTAMASTSLGAMIASLVRTEEQAGGVTILALLVLAGLGGCFVPSFVMPGWMRDLGAFTPHAWALGAYQDVLVRGLDLVAIAPKLGVLGAFAAVFSLVARWRFRV